MEAMRVAIIGGGIAGLAAAYELELARQDGGAIEYELYEAGARLGGVISSSVEGGTVIERGPDSFLTEKPAASTLCRELGLESDLVPSNDAERKTFILVRNRLLALPDGLMFLVPTKLLPTLLTPLFSWWTKLRMGLEVTRAPLGPHPDDGDESVASLVRRHYGQQAVDRLADPLLSGIYGGEAEKLSARAVLPRLVEMEAKYGSLTRGMLAGIKARKAAEEAARNQGADVDIAPAPKPLFTTLRYGLQQMVDALTARLDPRRVHLHAPVLGVERDGDGWLVEVRGVRGVVERFDAVIVATPAWAAAEFLRPLNGELSDELEQIPYSSSATVNLVYDGADLDPLPEGFGFLVPAVERRSILACTFLHRKFPGRTAPGKSVLRAFVGGAHNADLLAETDEVLVELMRRDLMEILQISAEPEMVEVQRWPRAMAQYSVGHQERLERIRARVAELPGLHLVGNAYDGIGISDCIRLGRVAARDISRGIDAQKDNRRSFDSAMNTPTT
jgi:oxygen-dependent protoporphyrinogen oxidase